MRPSLRGSGLGRKVIAALANEAAERGTAAVFARPPLAEAGFFERAGFGRGGGGGGTAGASSTGNEALAESAFRVPGAGCSLSGGDARGGGRCV